MDSFKIIANGYVITCDGEDRGGGYNLLIRNDRIVEVSDKLDPLTAIHPYATVVDASNKLIMPGFINAHFHSESVLLRSRTDDLHCSLWKTDLRTQECIKELLNPLNQEDIRNVHLMSYFSHLKSGTTCAGEFGLPYTEKSFVTALQAIARTEVKNVVALQNWDQISKVSTSTGERHRFLMNVGKEEEFTVYSFENLLRAARDLKVPLLAHVGEQRGDVENVKKTFRKSIFGVLQEFTAVRPDTVFVHLNHFNNQETKMLAEAGGSVVVCARSAAFKRTGYPSLRHLMRKGIRLAVGTDWGGVDMLEELKFLHRLHLLISGIPQFSPLELVRMGTINGAHTLGLSQETGSIEAGKKADLTFFSLDDVRLPVISGNANSEMLASLLLHDLSIRDVSDVMINGEFYVAKGEVMTMAEDEIAERFRSTHNKLFREEAQKIPRPTLLASDTTAARTLPKILPFTHTARTLQPLEEGFESGFRPVEKPRVIAEMESGHTQPNPPPAAPVAEEIHRAQQEPSKGTWLTFGEDEDF